MESRSIIGASRTATDQSRRVPALAAGLGLLVMAVLAPIAQFGVLAKLVVPADPAATVSNIAGSPGQFSAAIAAFLVVAILDVVVAWGLYGLLRPADERLARLVASLRIVYAAGFALALLNLLDVARTLSGASAADLQSEQLRAHVAASIASFDGGWNLALAIFGTHLVALGGLLVKFAAPRLLAALVVVAGAGYLVDSIATILVSDYSMKISTFTFVGEAILIFWLLWIAIKGVRTATPARAASGSSATTSTRSPVLAIAGSFVAGLALAFAFLLGPASGGSEPTITGSGLFAFGLGWGLMAFFSTRFSAQPQRWMAAPAAFLGLTGLGLVVLQPGPAAMDVLSWIWPPALAALGIWMFKQIRAQLRGRGRWLVVPLTATLVLFALGGAFETVMAAAAPAGVGNGQLIDVGGHKLYISCTGSGPTVVLEAGLGETSSYWGWIAPEVAKTTRVCVYDRAGRGRSEAARGPVDGVAAAQDLHALLAGSGNVGPYVMAGHSSGGVYIRIFATLYPTEVAGMVLLDSQPADAFASIPSYPGFYEMIRPTSAFLPSLARLGVFRLANADAFGDLPADSRAAERADQSSPWLHASTHDEWLELPAALDEAGKLTTLGIVPLIVIEAASGAQVGWHEAQQHMAALSTNSSHQVLENATHTTLITSEIDSRSAIDAILDVLASVRTGEQVAGA